MSRARNPRLVPLYALLVAGLAVWFLWARLGGQPSGLRVLASLAITVFLLCLAQGIRRYRSWAWMVSTLGLLFGHLVVFVLFWLAVDRDDRPAMRKWVALLVFLAFSLWYLGRYEVERRFRPAAGAEQRPAPPEGEVTAP
ncbi:MAG: hypothetical protein ACE5JG_06935 [Planctomycetota bacterium]